MEPSKNLENFLKLVSDEPSSWLADAEWRKENSQWLERSAKIAIAVLRKLRHNKENNLTPSSQKELADSMAISPQYVNKIVKGQENLTLETISKLETALGIKILSFHSNEQENDSPIAAYPMTSIEISTASEPDKA